MTIPSTWTCSCCGKVHSGLPLDYGMAFPDYFVDWRSGLSEEEIGRRSFCNSDVCTVDDQYYFVRGVIEIPIIGFSEDQFRWGAWVSLSKKSFDEVMELWDKDSGHGPYFGWLNNALPLYSPSTLELKTNVHLQSNKLRPRIELEPTDHPLAVEQRNGISIERVQEIAAALLHKARPWTK